MTGGRLAAKVAVVTGGASGIGRAIAGRLAAEGARVAVFDIADAGATLADIEPTGALALARAVDVTDPRQVGSAAEDVLAGLGPVDIVVNNAGIYPHASFDELTLTAWRQMFAVNVDSMFLLCQAFLPGMKSRGWGRIVNLTSNSVGLVLPGSTNYLASKMAIIGLTRGLASEVAPFGITVNAIGPSLTRTPSTEAAGAEFFDIVAARQAIKRVQVPADLTGTVVFLSSADAEFITGQTIWVDGGLLRSG